MDELIKVDHKGQRVLTTQQLAESYDTEARRITENFGRNASKFQNGIHYFKLENEDLRKFKENALSVVAPNINVLYLWTERGALNHAKLLETDKAWDIFTMLVDTYFRVKESLFKVPQTFAEALRLAADQQETIELMKPKSDKFDQFMDAKNNQPMNNVAKTLGWGRNKLFEKLRYDGIFLKNNTPKQTYIDRGYFTVIQKPIEMGESIIDKPQTLATPKGIDWLASHLSVTAN